MSREAFLARVRQATLAGRAYRVAHDPAAEKAGYYGGGHDLPARLALEINAVGGQAELLPSLAAARDALANLFAKYKPRRALCWRHPLLEQLDLAGLLCEREIALADYSTLAELPPEQARDCILAAEIGITSTSWAIAETGSLALLAGPGRERLASLLPPVHVAVVGASQIVPDLCDLFARLQTDGLGNLPSNVVLVTGPSKTGDLELKLTTGVHGPKHWHVLIVRDR